MQGHASLKVPGGKLLRVRVNFTPEKIEGVEITGDFFVHPEQCIREIEEGLVGFTSKCSADDILEIMGKRVNLNIVEFVGVTPKDVADTIYRALI